MTKYHDSGNGEPGLCKAEIKCPFAGNPNTFHVEAESKDQARAMISEKLAEDIKTWNKAGFEDIDEIFSWRDNSFTPDEAVLWSREDLLDPWQAGDWRDRGYSYSEALDWTGHGFSYSDEAIGWIDSGFTPEESQDWQDAGVDDPSEARNYVNDGMGPDDI